MKVRITILTENEKSLPPVEERPTEEQIVKAWQDVFDTLTLITVFTGCGTGADRAIVESAEIVEEHA